MCCIIDIKLRVPIMATFLSVVGETCSTPRQRCRDARRAKSFNLIFWFMYSTINLALLVNVTMRWIHLGHRLATARHDRWYMCWASVLQTCKFLVSNSKFPQISSPICRLSFRSSYTGKLVPTMLRVAACAIRSI